MLDIDRSLHDSAVALADVFEDLFGGDAETLAGSKHLHQTGFDGTEKRLSVNVRCTSLHRLPCDHSLLLRGGESESVGGGGGRMLLLVGGAGDLRAHGAHLLLHGLQLGEHVLVRGRHGARGGQVSDDDGEGDQEDSSHFTEISK
ncbi:hypothetical protein PFISCL1PPCAC_17797, partial [Pristionchus fissidentatus]